MLKFWKQYYSFSKCSIKMRLSYPTGFLFNWLANLIKLLLSIFLWKALFQKQTIIQNYDQNQIVIYLLILTFLNTTLSLSTELNLSEKILNGSIANDLTKPVDIQYMSFFQALGESIIEGGMSLITITLLATLLTDITKYLKPMQLILFIFSVILAFFLKFCLVYLGGLLCFFTSNGFGVIYIRQIITDIFSGALLPLSFYPMWFQRISYFLPFQASVYFPTQIFLQRITGINLLTTLLIQLFWVIILWVFTNFCFQLAIQKITIHGG